MKEVKKNNPRENLYLYTYKKLKQGLYPSQIARELKCTKQKISYYLSSLKKAGFIVKRSYGVWEVIKEFNIEEVKKSTHVATDNPYQICTSKPDSVRGHAFVFTLQFPEDLRNWDKREKILTKLGIEFKSLNIFGGGQGIVFRNRKIHLTRKSIVIYEKSSYISDLAKDSQSHAISYFLKLVKGLERELQADFSFGGKYKFKVSRQHYALVRNALAKQYDDEGKKLNIFNKQGELWFIIDNSFNLHEAETVHPKTAVSDNEKVQTFFNEVKELEGYTPKFVTDSLGKVTEVQIQLAESQDKIMESQKELPGTINEFRQEIKSHLTLIKEYRKENIKYRTGLKNKYKKKAEQTTLGRWF